MAGPSNCPSYTGDAIHGIASGSVEQIATGFSRILPGIEAPCKRLTGEQSLRLTRGAGATEREGTKRKLTKAGEGERMGRYSPDMDERSTLAIYLAI